jgi:tetratricopeptide (TPR) repeat protein
MDKIITLSFNTSKKISRSISQKSIFIFDNQNLNEAMSYIDIKNSFDLKIQIIFWLEKMGITSNSLFPDDEGAFKNFDFLSPQYFFMNGFKMMNSDRFEEAAKEYEKVIKINPNISDAYGN